MFIGIYIYIENLIKIFLKKFVLNNNVSIKCKMRSVILYIVIL